MKAAVRNKLRDRWASVVEEDRQTEGFWIDVERALGREATAEEQQEAREYANTFARRIRQGIR